MLVANNILMNPIKGSSHMAPRNMIIKSLTNETMNLMSNGAIRLYSVSYSKEDNIDVHIKLMSKSMGIEYDIILEFLNIRKVDGDKVINGVFPDKTEMKVFSNSPEFVFTYAYAFNKKGYIIPRYRQYIGSKALNDAPKIKNPNSDIGMSTSIFYSLKYLEIIKFFGNMQYLKFVNNIQTKPVPFEQIQKLSKNK